MIILKPLLNTQINTLDTELDWWDKSANKQLNHVLLGSGLEISCMNHFTTHHYKVSMVH